MRNKNVDILQTLISTREENIKLLLTWSDDDIKDMTSRYRSAKELAYEENRMEAIKILEEKISQLKEAAELKYSLSDEASDWIHW